MRKYRITQLSGRNSHFDAVKNGTLKSQVHLNTADILSILISSTPIILAWLDLVDKNFLISQVIK